MPFNDVEYSPDYCVNPVVCCGTTRRSVVCVIDSGATRPAGTASAAPALQRGATVVANNMTSRAGRVAKSLHVQLNHVNPCQSGQNY